MSGYEHTGNRPFPPSPYKPIIGTLGTIATIQALALAIALVVIALRDGTCYS